MLDDEMIRQLTGTARNFLDQQGPPWAPGQRALVGGELWRACADLGWLDLAASGETEALSSLCLEFGRHLFLPSFIAVAAGGLAALEAAGKAGQPLRDATVACRRRPVLALGNGQGSWERPYGVRLHAGLLSGEARFVPSAEAADVLLVPAEAPEGPTLFAVDALAPSVRVSPARAVGNATWSTVLLDGAAGAPLGPAAPTVARARTRAAALQAAWCAGASSRVLDLATEYARTRRQFGAPIGGFQAVQHRLADAAIRAAEAEALAREAARMLAVGGAQADITASAAFTAAATALVRVALAAHQVWGGLGYTLEAPVHWFSQAGKLIQHSWGGLADHRRLIGEWLLQQPPLQDIDPAPDGHADRMWGALEPGLSDLCGKVRAFLRENADPRISSQSTFPQGDTEEKRAFLAKVAASGWLGISWPVSHGGLGRHPSYQLMVQNELEYAGMPSASTEVGMIGPCLLRHGAAELTARFAARIVAGDIRIAIGYSESEAGSDLAAIRVTARRDPATGEYVVNGEKMWTSAAHFADVIWLACRTSGVPGDHHGLSILLVDRDSAGITVRPIATLGGHQTNAVYYDNVRVPATRLVGAENEGWSYIMEALAFERLVGYPIGPLYRDLDELASVLRDSGDPRVPDFLGEMYVMVAAAASHFRAAVAKLSRGDVPTIESTMLKVAITEARQALSDRAVDFLGPAALVPRGTSGSVAAGRFEHNWRSEIFASIGGGANEIQRNIIARRHLRLPPGNR